MSVISLAVNQAWIKDSGVANPTTVEAIAIALPTLSRPQDVINGESEVGASDEVSRVGFPTQLK